MAKKKDKNEKIFAKEYAQILSKIKDEISQAQIEAATSANKILIKLYWSIGKTIDEKQKAHNWGSNFLEQLAKDLQRSFPGMGGFSRTNISRMRAFYRAYGNLGTAVPKLEKLPIFRIPWGHNILILQRSKSIEEMLWYAEKTIVDDLSRSSLENYFKTESYERTGVAVTNFKRTLPSPHSEVAHQTLKDPYLFDFLTLHKKHKEKDLEHGLICHIQKFLLELGEGFAFIGRQYHLQVSDSDYYIDLLFYHIRLRCFIVIELKATAFKPEYAGKLNFYLSAVDDLLRKKGDKPTIGLLLCKTKDKFKAEYALRDINKPIGVAEYETKLVEALPENLKSSLPDIEDIEKEIEKQEMLHEIEKKKKKKN